MPLTPHQALSVVIIIFYFPSLIPTSFLLHRRGIGKAWGWLYLSIFSIFRVTGASLQIAAESSQTNGLQTAASTFASIGVMTLLLAMLEVIEDVKGTFASDPIHPRIWTLLHLAQYAAFTLSVVSSFKSHQGLGAAAAIIVACLFACQSAICVIFYLRFRSNQGSLALQLQIHTGNVDNDLTKGERRESDVTKKLLHLALASTPFLTIRVLYMLLATFVHGATFQGKDLDDDGDSDAPANVFVLAFMQYTMEFGVFALFLYAGFVMPAGLKIGLCKGRKRGR
ncbi:hypothetical protein BDV06DRAFT_27546 [Aspergillus oleicola]